MELNISGRHMEITPRAREYIEQKFEKLGRHLNRITGARAKVEVAEEATRSRGQRFVVQVTVEHNGTLMRGQERGETLSTAVDKVVEVMDRQVKRYKGKLYKRGKGGASVREMASEETVEQEPAAKVVKEKQFNIKPMSLEEAVEQMELLGHDFFLFLDSGEGNYNLLYRRREGDYGLIRTQKS